MYKRIVRSSRQDYSHHETRLRNLSRVPLKRTGRRRLGQRRDQGTSTAGLRPDHPNGRHGAVRRTESHAERVRRRQGAQQLCAPTSASGSVSRPHSWTPTFRRGRAAAATTAKPATSPTARGSAPQRARPGTAPTPRSPLPGICQPPSRPPAGLRRRRQSPWTPGNQLASAGPPTQRAVALEEGLHPVRLPQLQRPEGAGGHPQRREILQVPPAHLTATLPENSTNWGIFRAEIGLCGQLLDFSGKAMLGPIMLRITFSSFLLEQSHSQESRYHV